MPTADTSRRAARAGAYLLYRASAAANLAATRLVRTADGLDLTGDRWVEWSFCMARLANGPGATLDFGADIGFLSLAAAQRGHTVVALDREPSALNYDHPQIEHVRADVLDRPIADRRFDQIINCSSVEHVGLAGRYGSTERPDGDIDAMRVLAGMLAPGGRMLLTIPVGRDGIHAPLHRIYGEERLPRLIEPFATNEEQFWRKDPATRRWRQTDRHEALAVEGSESFYALGLFVLGARS